MKRKVKIAYYLSHPIQYFSPLLVKLADKADLKVYYFSDASVRGTIDKGFGQAVKWDIPLLEGYDYRFLKNYARSKSMDNRFFDAINPAVIKTIRKDKAEIIIVNGWSYFSTLLAIVTGKLYGKKIWLRAESPRQNPPNNIDDSIYLLMTRAFSPQCHISTFPWGFAPG